MIRSEADADALLLTCVFSSYSSRILADSSTASGFLIALFFGAFFNAGAALEKNQTTEILHTSCRIGGVISVDTKYFAGETLDLATSAYLAAIQKGPKLAESIGFQCPALGFVKGSCFLLCLAFLHFHQVTLCRNSGDVDDRYHVAIPIGSDLPRRICPQVGPILCSATSRQGHICQGASAEGLMISAC